VANPSRYTAKLQAGLGLVAETKVLLQIWQPGMTVPSLYKEALDSGQFPNVTARRLRNIVVECFAPRYLSNNASPARHLKILLPSLTTEELQQFLMLFTCHANLILADFISQVYWSHYASGDRELNNQVARAFVQRAIDDGKTVKRWSDYTIKRIAGNLTGCCADYGLLENGVRSKRQFLSLHLSDKMATYLAYDLHYQGVGDSHLLHHPDWQIFGLHQEDVLAKLKQLSLNGWFLIQVGGDVVRISWKYSDMEEVCRVLAES
jgi:hypothetical protein